MTQDSEGGVLELATVIAAPVAEVWRVLTAPGPDERWLGEFHMTSSWRPGEPFTISGSLNGHDYRETGIVRAAEPPTLLRFEHWSPLWRVPDLPEHRATMTIRLAPDGEVTRVSLCHELPAVEAIVPHARFFWSVALEQLRRCGERLTATRSRP